MDEIESVLHHKSIVADHFAIAMRELLLIKLQEQNKGTRRRKLGVYLFSYYSICMHICSMSDFITPYAVVNCVGDSRAKTQDTVKKNLKSLVELEFLVRAVIPGPDAPRVAYELADPTVMKSLRFLGEMDTELSVHRVRWQTGSRPDTAPIPDQIARAAELLESSDIPIGEIADACGYNSTAAFGGAFKRHRGVTPSEHRKASGRKPSPSHRRSTIERVARAAELLESSDMPIGEIAATCGYNSPAALNGAFKRYQGVTPSWHRMARRWKPGLSHGRSTIERVARAAELLESSDMPIHEIAATCGFTSPAWFSAAFKRHQGVTPSDYRRRAG